MMMMQVGSMITVLKESDKTQGLHKSELIQIYSRHLICDLMKLDHYYQLSKRRPMQ